MTSIKKKYGRAAGSGEVPSAFATMAKADKIGTEKFTAKKTYGGDVGLGLNSDALEMHRKKLAEKNGTGKLASSIHSRGSSHSKRGGGRPKLDILSLVDGAIEDGATCEAKEKAAAEKAAADAPILPKKKVKVIKPKKTEEAKPPLAPPSKKAQEVTEKAIETKEPEKPTIDPPKPKSAKFLSSVDKAIESDAPAPGVPSLFGSSTSKTTTSTDGVPAWKAKLKAQKASGEVQSSTPQRQASARTPINIAKKADTIPKKSKSTPLVISKPKSPAKVSPAKQASSVEIKSPKPSPVISQSSPASPVKAPSPKPSPVVAESPVTKKSPLRSPKPKVSPPISQMSPVKVASSPPALESEKPTVEKPLEKENKTPSVPATTLKPKVYESDSDDSSDSSDDDTPKKKMPKKVKTPIQIKTTPLVIQSDKPDLSDDEEEFQEPTLTKIDAPALDRSLLVPSGDVILDRLRKELEDTTKKFESVTINAKIELADMKKEFNLEKETLRIHYMKDIQSHKKANEQADKEHQKIVEREQAQVEELKAANAKLRTTLKKLPMQMAEVTLSNEALSKANEDIAGHFAELAKFAKKLQADQDKLQESSQKCKDEYLPRYRQELWDRQQHLNAETKIKNLYRECMIKIHHRIDETNHVGLIEAVATMVLETEGEVNPKFDPKFLSEKPKKKGAYDLDSDDDSDSDSSSSSDSDSD
jgi:hypothetical protein